MRILAAIVLHFLTSLALGRATETNWKEQISEASVLIHQGRFEDATTLLREVAMAAKDSEDRAVAFTNLGFAYASLGRYLQAERSLRTALFLHRESGGDENPKLATPLNNLAALYIETHRYIKARETLKKAAVVAQHERDGEELADLLINLGEVERVQRNFDEAEACYREALAILERCGGRRQRSTAVVLLNLGVLSLDRGDSSRAIPYVEQALEVWRTEFGDEHPDVANAWANLARAVAAEGRFPEAETMFRRALSITDICVGPKYPKVAEILQAYADVLQRTKRKREARRLEKKAELIRRQNRQANLLYHTVDLSELHAGLSQNR